MLGVLKISAKGGSASGGNKLKSIISIAAMIFAGLLTVSGARAADPQIAVIFAPNPLFGAVNFIPGDSTTARVEVRNLSGAIKPIAIEAINVDDPDKFGDVLNLEIKEGSNTILNKSLTAFFNQGETFLSDLADNASTTYDLIVTFDAGAGNDYQNKALKNFDILVGFQGEQTPETPPGQGGGGGSGGGSVLLPGLMIFNEASINVSNDSATLTWQTNYLSASRVIYSAENEPHDFNYGNPSNYGYAHSTVDDLTQVTFHTVNLTGLTPDTLYYYRAISHASPDTVGASYTFRTPAASAIGNPIVSEQGNNTQGNGNVAAAGAVSGATGATLAAVAGENNAGNAANQATVSSTEQAGQVLGAEEQNGQVAGAVDICKTWPYWLWIILALIYLLMLGINYADKIKHNIREKYGSYLNWSFSALPIIAAILAMIFFGVWAWWLWILMVIFYLILIIFYFVHLDSPIYWRVSVLVTLYMAVIAWLVSNYLC